MDHSSHSAAGLDLPASQCAAVSSNDTNLPELKIPSPHHGGMVKDILELGAISIDRLLTGTSLGLAFLDRDGRILRAARGFCALLGYEEHELISRSFVSLLYSGESGLLKNAGASECRLLHKNGSPVWAIVSPSKISQEYGLSTPVAVMEIVPIEHQKRIEARSTGQLEQLHFALDAADQGAWEYDGATETWHFSSAWKRMRGIPADENYVASGLGWLDQVHPDDRGMVKDISGRQYAGELREVAFEYRERHRDGHWIWILARGRCLNADDIGKPIRVVGTDTDITEIKQRELDLAAMSKHFELALSTSKVGVWEANLQTKGQFWDARTCELFGMEPRSRIVEPGTWESLVHPDDRAQAIAACERGLAQNRGFTSDFRVVLPDGVVRHLRSQAAIVTDATGREKVIGVNWDISQDVERTEELRRAKQLAEERNLALEAAKQDLERISLHDPLTGLANRRHLDKVLAGWSRPQGATLIHIDLDRFKHINDTKGSAAGDALLAHAASLLRTHLRPGDFISRIGGDEFIALLTPSPDRETLDGVVARVIRDMSRPFMWNGQECRSGATIGIAEAKGVMDAHQLRINADIALYQAKRAGRGCAAYFTNDMNAEVAASKRLADGILKGLERGEFEPHFQPQFDAQTLEIAGLEVSVRWRHPERGLLLPAQFLAVAGEIYAAARIERIILEQAARAVASWDGLGVLIPRIAVTLSARRLGEAALLDSLAALPIEPQRIALKLLESDFLDGQNGMTAKNIAALKERGFTFGIGEFGTGHASISSLLNIRPHEFKIGRQLILPVTEDEPQRELVRAIAAIGKSQNIAICADGADTARHVTILRDLGCDFLQGCYFATPMPACDVPGFVAGRSWIKESKDVPPVAAPDGSALRGFMHERGLDLSDRKAMHSIGA